jgi:hypothetical protein
MKVRTTEKLVLHTGTGTVVVWVHANRYSKGQGRAGQGTGKTIFSLLLVNKTNHKELRQTSF